MKVQPTAGGILAIAALGVGSYLAYKAYKAGTSAADELRKMLEKVKQAGAQAAADVQSTVQNNIVAPFNRGQAYANGEPDPLVVSSKAWLYSDYAYTGVDAATGKPITDGEWYADAVARRYDAEQRAAGASPAATSINGAAFGVYPKP